MAVKFWDRVFQLILSKGQREKHEKYLWDKRPSEVYSSPSSPSTRPSLDKPTFPEFKPTIPPNTIVGKVPYQRENSPESSLSSSSTTSGGPRFSPNCSRPSSPARTAVAKVPRAPLPRHPREDRAYIILDPLMETEKHAMIDTKVVGQRPEHDNSSRIAFSPSSSPSKCSRMEAKPTPLYEVPPLSEMQGIGRYRRSINATEDFVEFAKARDDSYADLLAAAEKGRKRTSGEWSKGVRRGNMDTTSPPPPRSAFCSRANSPVRLEYRKVYGDDVDIFGEEELAEVNGRLLFCRRKSRESDSHGKPKVDLEGKASTDDGQETTISGEGDMTTADIVAAVAKRKATSAAVNGGAFPKRKPTTLARDGETGKTKKKSHEGRNGQLRPSAEGDKVKIEHIEDLDEAAIETDCEDVEEVESFSETKGNKLITRANKERLGKGVDPVRRGRKPCRGLGQGGGVGGGTNSGVRATGRGKGLGGKANGVVGGRRIQRMAAHAN